MNISAYGHKFFVFGGILLIVIAVVQYLTRRRDRGAPSGFRLDAATVKTLAFFIIGALAVLAGAGVLPLPGDPP